VKNPYRVVSIVLAAVLGVVCYLANDLVAAAILVSTALFLFSGLA
jgi:hypothetical protein